MLATTPFYYTPVAPFAPAMPRMRPRSLNLRTPIGDQYSGPPTRSSRYSPTRTPNVRLRYCRQCVNGYYPVTPSPAYYPMPYMFPMMYAATPAPMAPMAPMPTPMAPPMMYEDPVPLPPEPPYPLYETSETSESDEMDETRTTTEEYLSTLQRSTMRRQAGTPSNFIRDFEETNWIPLNGEDSKEVHDFTIRRANWFQRSVELPNGIITKLSCKKMPAETSGSGTMRRYMIQKLLVSGFVRQYSTTQRAITEERFSEVSPFEGMRAQRLHNSF